MRIKAAENLCGARNLNFCFLDKKGGSGAFFALPLPLIASAIEEPLEDARLALDGNLQMWADAEDSLRL